MSVSKGAIIFVTGTDTGVGKTVLTALLVRHARRAGCRALAMKPFCSGGLSDARLLRAAQDNELSIDEISPFRFRPAVSPLVGARLAGERVTLEDAISSIDALARRCELLLIEGAGGLLAPLGETFTAREMIFTLRCSTIVVAPNKLGAISHSLLTIKALDQTKLPPPILILMNQGRSTLASRTNRKLIREFGCGIKAFELPFLGSLAMDPRQATRLKKPLHNILCEARRFRKEFACMR